MFQKTANECKLKAVWEEESLDFKEKISRTKAITNNDLNSILDLKTDENGKPISWNDGLRYIWKDQEKDQYIDISELEEFIKIKESINAYRLIFNVKEKNISEQGIPQYGIVTDRDRSSHADYNNQIAFWRDKGKYKFLEFEGLSSLLYLTSEDIRDDLGKPIYGDVIDSNNQKNSFHTVNGEHKKFEIGGEAQKLAQCKLDTNGEIIYGDFYAKDGNLLPFWKENEEFKYVIKNSKFGMDEIKRDENGVVTSCYAASCNNLITFTRNDDGTYKTTDEDF